MKRYDFKTFTTKNTLGFGFEFVETEDGMWIKYDDFKAIENSLAALMKQLGLSPITGCYEKEGDQKL